MVHFDKPSTPKTLSLKEGVKSVMNDYEKMKRAEKQYDKEIMEEIKEKTESKPRKVKPALSDSFWISWGFLQTSIDSVFKKWPSMHAHFDIVKTELEGLK